MKAPLILLFAFAMLLVLNIASADEPVPAPVAVHAEVVNPPPVVMEQSPVATPPAWLVDALKMVSSLPIIGAYVALALQWFGVLATIMSSLLVFLAASIKLLKTVSTFGGFDKLLVAIEAFEQSAMMQWLRWSSNFAGPKK